MAYTTIDNPELFFQTKLYSGTGSSQSVTLDGDENMQPDWVWGKGRTLSGYNHGIVDSVRGVSKLIYSNLTDAEDTYSTGITSLNTDGFTTGSGNVFNNGSNTYVAWNWKAGTSFTNDASSTSVGTIDSTGSVNTDAGFSIISYTGNGNSNQTVAHGLGSTVDMVIVKDRDRAGEHWVIYHKSLGKDKYILFNTDAAGSSSDYFGTSTPNSTVFGLKTGNTSNNWSGDKFIAYCFASKKGYSKVGSYTGNGNADGTFIYCGFRPAWLMVKRTDSADYWYMFDNKRDVDNVIEGKLEANTADAEYTSVDWLDFTASGFKWRYTGGGVNASGGSFIYMAFAESPFVNSAGAVPTNAR